MGRSLLGILMVVSGLPAPGAAQAAGPYVALGDSYTAGPLIANQVGTPVGCARSDRNYPSLTAQALAFTLRDVSCSSATTRHMEEPQTDLPAGGTNPPQFDGVTPSTAPRSSRSRCASGSADARAPASYAAAPGTRPQLGGFQLYCPRNRDTRAGTPTARAPRCAQALPARPRTSARNCS